MEIVKLFIEMGATPLVDSFDNPDDSVDSFDNPDDSPLCKASEVYIIVYFAIGILTVLFLFLCVSERSFESRQVSCYQWCHRS